MARISVWIISASLIRPSIARCVRWEKRAGIGVAHDGDDAHGSILDEGDGERIIAREDDEVLGGARTAVTLVPPAWG